MLIATNTTCLRKVCTFFFWLAVLRRPSFCLSRLRLRGKQGIHRCIATHVWIPAELRGGALEHPTSLSGLLRQGVAFRLAEPRRSKGKPTFRDNINSPLPSHILFSLRLPALCTASSVQLFLPSLLSATTQQQHSFVTATNGASVCMYMCSCTWSVCCHRHTIRSRRAVCLCFLLLKKHPLSHAATKTEYSRTAAALQRQPCS